MATSDEALLNPSRIKNSVSFTLQNYNGYIKINAKKRKKLFNRFSLMEEAEMRGNFVYLCSVVVSLESELS